MAIRPASRTPRIIPARAGFTQARPTWVVYERDHPRSRGVYNVDCSELVSYAGSSPLARGLPLVQRLHLPLHRIIPARAGFTANFPTFTLTNKDHPRSRGVYTQGRAYDLLKRGSSPLARGLRRLADTAGHRRRIIPARAGFTPTSRPRWTSHADHPRSRGVYPACPRCSTLSSGSSPLARGLQDAGERVGGAHGIIPARAGFTAPPCRPAPRPADHPRSRGVYVIATRRDLLNLGSSPLARGLRVVPVVVAARERIIPARAGFTCPQSPAWRAFADHPRSRGVYVNAPPALAGSAGSSPLARGLRSSTTARRPWLRIIPARAGFTPPFSAAWRTWGDHPRSRGVYGWHRDYGRRLAGSSPLARGLHARSRRRHRRDGIIPARAGFTWSSSR